MQEKNEHLCYFFVHLASAAFLAIFDRSCFDRAFALALPPFRPPSRPSATAAGFFFFFGSVLVWPVVCETMEAASWFKSLLERLGMHRTCRFSQPVATLQSR